MSFTFFSWLLALSAGISLSLAIVALRRRAITGALPFAVALFGEFIWCAGYWFELRAPSLGGKIFWDNVQFLGTDLGVSGALLFAHAYTGHEIWPRPSTVILAVVPGITLLFVWTNPLHDLIRSNPQLVTVGGQQFLSYTYGPWFWVFVGYGYLLTIGTMILLITFAVQSRAYRQRVLTFVLGFSVPVLGALVTVFGLVPVANLERLDISPLAFAVTSPLMAWTLFRKRILDIVPIARTLLIEQMYDAVLVTDLQGRVIDTNPQALRLFARSNAAIIGAPASDLLPDIGPLMSDSEERQQRNLRLHQHPPIDIEAAVTVLRDRRQNQLGWLIVLRDITALAQQARYQHTLAECSQILLRGGQHVVEVDEVLDTVLGLLRRAAGVGRIDICQNMIGVDGEIHAQIVAEERCPDVQPFPLTACLPWRMLPTMRDALSQGQVLSGPVTHLFDEVPQAAQMLAAGGVNSLLLMPLHGTGTWWGILRASSDQPDQIWGSGMLDFLRSAADMIAVSIRQWEASRTLHEREHFIQRVAHATPDMLYVYNLRTQQLIYINTTSSPSGHTPEQVLGLEQEEGILLADEHTMRLAYVHQIASAADQEVCSLEYRVQAVDGRMIWLLRRDTIFARDTAGVPTQILGVVQDITERQQRAEALLLAKDEAEAANRAKSTFLSMMSHELRTPLTAIIGYSQLLEQLMEVGDYRTVVSDLHHIYTAGKHLLALINDVLDLSRIEAGKLHVEVAPIWLPELIRDVTSTVRPLVERNQNTLMVDHPAEISMMRSDATKVRQILLNLLNNAAKFTEHGTIILSLTRTKVGDEPWILFRVSDTGIGIDKQHLPRLFTPFSQVDESLNRRYGGTGLGLALSQRLCQLLGGEISAESELGKGSIFTVRLPMQRPSSPDFLLDLMPAARHNSLDTDTAPCEATGRPGEAIILVIDDNLAANSVISRMLGSEQAHIVYAPSAQRGLELARDILPELIVIDALLPALPDGQSVYDVIKADPELSTTPTMLINIDDIPLEEHAHSHVAHQLRHLLSGKSAAIAHTTVSQH